MISLKESNMQGSTWLQNNGMQIFWFSEQLAGNNMYS